MAYSEHLAARVRRLLDGRDVTEKKMFGGLAFLVGGHMAVGVLADELMVRVGPDGYADALARPHAREMDFTGKALKGFVYVAAEGVRHGSSLRAWVRRGADFAGSLPPK